MCTKLVGCKRLGKLEKNRKEIITALERKVWRSDFGDQIQRLWIFDWWKFEFIKNLLNFIPVYYKIKSKVWIYKDPTCNPEYNQSKTYPSHVLHHLCRWEEKNNWCFLLLYWCHIRAHHVHLGMRTHEYRQSKKGKLPNRQRRAYLYAWAKQ